jgi:hypothetical protein
MGRHSNRGHEGKPSTITWAEAIDVGRTAIGEISRGYSLNIRGNSLFAQADSVTLLILADLMGLSPNGSDEASRLMRRISPRANHLPSADTALAAVNSTSMDSLTSDFRSILSRQVAAAREQGAFEGDLIVAGDSHDVKRHSKLRIRGGKGKERKRVAEDVRFVVGTKPERGSSWAHKFLTLVSTGDRKYTVDMEPCLPLLSLVDTISVMLDRTEALLGKKVHLLLWDAAAFSAQFARTMLERGCHFIVRAPKNQKVTSVIRKFNGLYGGIERYRIDEDPGAAINLVAVSTDLLRKKRVEMPLVDDKEKWITLATDLGPLPGEDTKDFLIRIVRLYRRRWCVETSYRCVEDFHGYTHSLHYQSRLLLFATAVLLYNVWVSRATAIRNDGGQGVTKHLLGFLLAIVLLLSWKEAADEVEIAPWSIDTPVRPDGRGHVG